MLDPETRTLSGDCFKLMLEMEGQRAMRYAYFFSILVIGIDHLKSDELLPTIAGIIRKGIRRTDLIGRMGHQGFSVILHHAETHNAYSVGERICDVIKNNHFVLKNSQDGRTVSIGGACFPTHTVDLEDLLLTAYRMLEKARSNGGDGVHLPEIS